VKKIKKKYNVSMDIKPAFGTSGGTPPGNPSGCPQLQYNTSLQPDIQSGYGWWETSLLCPDNQQPQNNPYGGEYCPTWWQWTGFVWPWDDNCDPSTYGSYQGGVSCIEVVGCESYGIGNSNAQSATMHNEMCELGCWNCIWCEMHGECKEIYYHYHHKVIMVSIGTTKSLESKVGCKVFVLQLVVLQIQRIIRGSVVVVVK